MCLLEGTNGLILLDSFILCVEDFASVHLFVIHMPTETRRGTIFPETGVMDDCEPLCEC